MIKSLPNLLNMPSVEANVAAADGAAGSVGEDFTLDFNVLLGSFSDLEASSGPKLVQLPSLESGLSPNDIGNLLPDGAADASASGNPLPPLAIEPPAGSVEQEPRSLERQATIPFANLPAGQDPHAAQARTASPADIIAKGQFVPTNTGTVPLETATSQPSDIGAESEEPLGRRRPIIQAILSPNQAREVAIRQSAEAFTPLAAGEEPSGPATPVVTNLKKDILAALGSHSQMPTEQAIKVTTFAEPSTPAAALSTSGTSTTSTITPATPSSDNGASTHRQLETLIDNLTEARESGRSARGEMLLRHAEFGAVALRLDQADGDLTAKLSSRDPLFAAAAQAALSERTSVAATSESSTGSQRGNDQSGLMGQSRDGASPNGNDRNSNGHGAAQNDASDAHFQHGLSQPDHDEPGDSNEQGRFA